MNTAELVVVKKVKLSQKVAKVVKERREAGMCIACGEVPPNKREICNRCYSRFQLLRPSKDTPIKRARYEAAMMEAGKIGINRQGSNGKMEVYKKIAAGLGGDQ